jgi:hypothetical protein
VQIENIVPIFYLDFFKVIKKQGESVMVKIPVVEKQDRLGKKQNIRSVKEDAEALSVLKVKVKGVEKMRVSNSGDDNGK